MKKLHAITSIIAFLTVTIFLVSTVLADLFCSHETIAKIKSLIVLPGLVILIPAMAITGATGFKISKGRKGKLEKEAYAHYCHEWSIGYGSCGYRT